MSGKTPEKILEDHFPELSEIQAGQLSQLAALYTTWNDKINVISRKDIDNVFERHILHGLLLSKFTSFSSGTRIMDLGTGGGIPGLPMAIMFPEVQFTLLDARAKKLKVIDDIVDQLGLPNVRTVHQRVETYKSKFDFVISRAVAPADQLVRWSRKLIHTENINPIPNGLICLKGGDLSAELNPLRKQYYIEQVPISDYYADEYFEEKFIIYIQLP